MKVLEAILKRSSCRAYTASQVGKEDLEKLLVAADAAPVGMARYDAVALTVVQDKALLDEIDSKTKEVMPQLAMEHPLYDAPTGIVVSILNEPGLVKDMLLLSAGAIMENILLEATDLGLGSTFLMGAGYAIQNSPEICRELKVPDGFAPVAIAIVGHSQEEKEAKEPTTTRIKTEFV